MMKCISIDDEPLAHRVIKKYCENLSFLTIQKECHSALEALNYLHENDVDLIFLDINMPELKGLDFLRTLTNPPLVIVTTAYQEYAMEGYELNVMDYLLKPFSFERFVKAINKSINTQSQITTTDTKVSNEDMQFFVKGDKKYHQVKSSEILFIEAYGNYTKLYFLEEYIISHEGISYYENMLSATQFLRVHKSFIIALDKIKQIEGNVIWIASYKVPIGRTYKSTVSKLYLS